MGQILGHLIYNFNGDFQHLNNIYKAIVTEKDLMEKTYICSTEKLFSSSAVIIKYLNLDKYRSGTTLLGHVGEDPKKYICLIIEWGLVVIKHKQHIADCAMRRSWS